MKTGIRFIKDWTDTEFPRLSIIITDAQVTLVTEVFGGPKEVGQMVTQLSAFRKDTAEKANCTLNFDKFYQEFSYGSLLMSLQSSMEQGVQMQVAIRSATNSSWSGHAAMQMKTKPGALDSFIQDLEDLCNTHSNIAFLEGKPAGPVRE